MRADVNLYDMTEENQPNGPQATRLQGYVTRSRAAELLGVSRRTVDRMVEDGRLTAYEPEPASDGITIAVFDRTQVLELRKAREAAGL